MKKIILSFALVASAVNAASIEEASALFASRSNQEAGVANAIAAADMYRDLAKVESDMTKKAQLKMQEAAAAYFIGNRVSGEDNILNVFERGYTAADFASKNLTGSDKATALYWFAANQGRWGETKGVLSSLSRWKGEMKPALEEAMKMGEEGMAVEFYGPLRVMGKAYMKVPFESKKKGMAWLKQAYDKTLKTVEVDGEEIEVAAQVNNALFYMFALAKKDSDVDTFCEIYDNTEILYEGGVQAWSEFDANAVPEVEKELSDFFTGKGEWENSIEYYDENC